MKRASQAHIRTERTRVEALAIGCVPLILAAVLLLCYANSFHASWQYDDFANIVRNKRVHMSQWSWEQLRLGLSAGMDFQIISRPLAYFSFALNHKFGGLEVFGYHLTNFCIHWTAAVFLFLFIRETLSLPTLNLHDQENQITAIAGLAALFWASHPIHVTAVTYIVQRMASMAGMFYIMAMYFYLKFRIDDRKNFKFIFLVSCGLSAFCALLTKENSLMLGYALVLYELLLVRGVRHANAKRILFRVMGITLAVGAAGLLYTDMDFKQLVASYDIRPFTPFERLLTQPRVMLIYLALIVVPMTSRMTILHDIGISHTLFSPWTTALSIALLLACIIALILSARKYPLVGFCGLFFFLNHLIEGSFLNLELIYEHRNYIPSMFIFVVPSIGFVKALFYFHYRRPFQWMLTGSVLLLIISNCYTTYAYNRIYETELSLWLHAVQRAPRLSLSHSNLGSAYWRAGLWDKAHDEFLLADRLNRYNNTFHQGAVYFNLGLYAAYREEDYKSAVVYFSKAKELYPHNYEIWYQLGLSQIVAGERDAALKTISAALETWPANAEFRYLSALVKLKNGNCRRAIDDAAKGLKLNPNHGGTLMVMAQSYSCIGELKRSIAYWERFIRLEPNDLHGIVALMEHYALVGQKAMALKYLNRFLRLKGDQHTDDLIDIARKKGVLGAYVPEAAKIKGLIGELKALKKGKR